MVSPTGPDGNFVYAIGPNDSAIAEFSRGADGSLACRSAASPTSSASDSSCTNKSATGLVDPQAIAISPNGENVYVAAEDTHEGGDIAVFTVGADGTLTQLEADPCIAENTDQTDGETSDCADQSGHGIEFPDALAVAPNGDVYAGDDEGEAVAEFVVGDDGALSRAGRRRRLHP